MSLHSPISTGIPSDNNNNDDDYNNNSNINKLESNKAAAAATTKSTETFLCIVFNRGGNAYINSDYAQILGGFCFPV